MGHSTFLFKDQDALDGAARILDLFGNFDDYNASATPAEADARALYHDIAALREDSEEAIRVTRARVYAAR